MDYIIIYLQEEILPFDKKQAHQIRIKVARFYLSPDVKLYKRFFTDITSNACTQMTPTMFYMNIMMKFTETMMEEDLWLIGRSMKDIVGRKCRKM